MIMLSSPTRLLGEASATDVLNAMNAHNQKVFWLSAISTAAVSVSALFTLYRTQKLLRKEFGIRKARKASR
jgi:hypothetical protein